VIHEETKGDSLAFVSAAHGSGHAPEVVAAAVRSLAECLDPPLSSLIRRGDQALVKAIWAVRASGTPESESPLIPPTSRRSSNAFSTAEPT
jgi:hypothetical protein